jgi:hypothetical protein
MTSTGDPPRSPGCRRGDRHIRDTASGTPACRSRPATRPRRPPALCSSRRCPARPQPSPCPPCRTQRALSRRFRGGLVSRLRTAFETGCLPRITEPREVKWVRDALMASEWVVYPKPCLARTDTLIDDLGRCFEQPSPSAALP